MWLMKQDGGPKTHQMPSPCAIQLEEFIYVHMGSVSAKLLEVPEAAEDQVMRRSHIDPDQAPAWLLGVATSENREHDDTLFPSSGG